MSNNAIVTLVSRILLSILFIPAGFGKLTAIGGTAGYFASKGLPLPTVTAVIVGLVELLGGLAVLVGFQTRYAAILLGFSRLAQHLSVIWCPGIRRTRSTSSRTSPLPAVSSCLPSMVQAHFRSTPSAADRI